MDINQITPDYAVAGQIALTDLETLVARGFTTVICNRPDQEISADLQSGLVEAAARALGLEFVYNPISGQGMTMNNLTRQGETLAAAKGPVFAYCRSGTRSTVVWSFVQAGSLPVDEIVAAAARGGYNIDNMRPQIESLAAQKQG